MALMNMLKVGDEVGFGRYGSRNHTLLSHGFSRVTKINHHGHILLENGKQFDKHGRERKVAHGGLHLMEAHQLRAQLDVQNQARARGRAAQELREILDGQRNGFGEQCKMDAHTKARMIALVNQL